VPARALRFAFYSFTLAQVVSLLGDRLNQFSVVGMIGRINAGDAVELFQLAMFSYLPTLLAPLFAGVIDRANKAMVLVVVDALRGAVVLLIPALFDIMGNLYAFYVPVFVLTLANLWFSPAKSAVIPEIFGEKYLLQINAVLWGLGIVGTMAGFLLGGWLFDFHSWRLSFYCDGASYGMSVVLMLPLLAASRRRNGSARAAIRADVRAISRTRRLRALPYRVVQSLVGSLRDGLGVIRDNRPVRHGLAFQTMLFAALGMLYVLGIARVQSVFPPDKTIYLSIVATAGTVGLLAGSALATALRRWFTIRPIIIQSTVIFAASAIGIARTESLAPMSLWAGVMGLSVSPLFILTETLLQVATPQAFRGRVFSAREILTKSSFLAFSLVATAGAAVFSKEMMLVGVGVLLAGLAVLLASRDFLNA
jgi:MFS family permease